MAGVMLGNDHRVSLQVVRILLHELGPFAEPTEIDQRLTAQDKLDLLVERIGVLSKLKGLMLDTGDTSVPCFDKILFCGQGGGFDWSAGTVP